MQWLLDIPVDDTVFLGASAALAIAAMLYLVARTPTRRWVLTVVIAIVTGVFLARLACWLVGDVLNLFGAPVTPQMKLWVSIAFAGIALAIVNLWRARWRRRAVAILSIPLLLLAGGAWINHQIGALNTVGDALGVDPYHSTSLASETAIGSVPARVVRDWKAPAGLPARGRIVQVRIPGTASHFAARPADLYLPPAALVAHPPVLPVLVMLSGQPGGPSNWFSSGHLAQYFDRYAAQHGGLAPIVVSPDQLGDPANNPLCVDSPLGNVATYLLVDVPHWLRAHLQVASGRRAWAIGGFSEGATCASQLLAGHPDVFGSMIASSSELVPNAGPATVQVLFRGSRRAYRASWPVTLMRRHAPYTDTVAVFGAGGQDRQYSRWARRLARAARKAGMHTRLIISSGTGHDWFTVAEVVNRGMPLVLTHMGLPR